jgi:ankyrin repeat protein
LTFIIWQAGRLQRVLTSRTPVKLLLEKRADVELRTEYGQTPLSWAAAGNGYKVVVKLLLKRGPTWSPRMQSMA